MAEERMFLVTNRSAGRVYYSVPDLGIKSREFQPGETKRLSYSELEGLSYLPGGMAIIKEYLQIKDEKAREDLVGQVEPEYNMTETEVKELITKGSMDEWLDCLDFAPEGVIDLIKDLSVSIPLTDTQKMAEFKKKKGVDLERMIRSKEEERAEEEAAKAQEVKSNTTTASIPTPIPARRTTGSKYKVINKTTEE